MYKNGPRVPPALYAAVYEAAERAEVQISKTDTADVALEDSEFTLVSSGTTSDKFPKYAVADAAGTAKFQDLPIDGETSCFIYESAPPGAASSRTPPIVD